MPKTSDELIAIDVRNQVLLERLKAGEHKKLIPFLERLTKNVTSRIVEEGDTIETKRRLNALVADVNRIQKEIYDEYIEQLSGNLGDISLQQAEFEARSYERVVVDYESVVPPAEQILAAVRINPMQIQDYAGDPLVTPFMRNWSQRETRRVTAAIQQGYYQGQTNSEIVTAIRGTRANRFNDGIVATSNRTAKAMVRTVVQHASTQARQSVMESNSDLIKGYEWVSTLDSRTCLAKNELILMADGSKKAIQDIQVGDRVIGHSGESRKVMNTIIKTTEQLLRVTLSDGNIVMCTDDHLWLTSNRGWVEAGELNGDDDIVEGKKIQK